MDMKLISDREIEELEKYVSCEDSWSDQQSLSLLARLRSAEEALDGCWVEANDNGQPVMDEVRRLANAHFDKIKGEKG